MKIMQTKSHKFMAVKFETTGSDERKLVTNGRVRDGRLVASKQQNKGSERGRADGWRRAMNGRMDKARRRAGNGEA